MKPIIPKSIAAFVAVGALLLVGCGGDDKSTGSTASSVGNGIDRAFVADMVPHHESAIEMARIAQRRGGSSVVKRLADDIISSQGKEIAVMRREDQALQGAGVKAGSLGTPDHMSAADSDPQALNAAHPFDAAFIKMMVPHHEGAIEMAKIEIAKGANPRLKALAQDIIHAQRREIAAMRKHIGDAGTAADAMREGSGHSG